MENLSGNVGQDTKITSHRPKPAKSGFWTLLWVGELGNIVSFRLTKPLVVTLTSGLATILAFFVFAIFSYHAMRTENKGLKRDLDKVRADHVAALKAKERALVRLAVLDAEAKPEKKKNGPAPGQKPPVRISQVAKPPAPPSQDIKDALLEDVTPVAEAPPAQPTETGQAEKPGSTESLSVEKLEIWREGQSDSVKFQFSIRNIDPEGRRIKGYTFVIFKPEKGSQEPLRAFPWTPLKDGRPTLFKRGQYFSITRFKFVSGTFPDIQTTEPFKTATVYVYSEAGKLLVEEVYKVDKILRS